MAKNSEVYKTAQERIKEFRTYCEKMHDRPGGSCGKQERCSVCSLKWLDIEAEEPETIDDIVAELRREPLAEGGAKPWLHYLGDRILAAHERDMKRMHDWCYALEDEMDGKDAEIARLRAALKPVLELDMSQFGFAVGYGECFEAVREVIRRLNTLRRSSDA